MLLKEFKTVFMYIGGKYKMTGYDRDMLAQQRMLIQELHELNKNLAKANELKERELKEKEERKN